MRWFEVDKEGLGKILERKGRAFVLNELIQNALDEQTSRIEVEVTRDPGSKFVTLTVTDDSPKGFKDLSHAFTLFAESAKKGDVSKRGRFNAGDKMVLALCSEARIKSTTGTIIFGADGRSRSGSKTDRGSVFTGKMRMTNEEMAECEKAVRLLLVPEGVSLSYNGEAIASRSPLACVTGALPTEIADQEGFLRRTVRSTSIEIHAVEPGDVARIYEMGIPVCETGDDAYHVNIMQKVPLSMDRDGVSASYLAKVRAMVVAEMASRLGQEEANSTWVKDAIERHGCELPPETVRKLIDVRFGEKRVVFDPSDPEANNRAAAAGYTVVHGSQLSKAEWGAVRAAEAMLPAGQVTPSDKPYSPDGGALKLLEEDKWTPGMRRVAGYSQEMARRLLGVSVRVEIACDVTWSPAATYGPGAPLVFNLGKLGHRWFDAMTTERINDLLLHELGHGLELNHLSENYYRALTSLGAKMVKLALEQPELFELGKYDKVLAEHD